VLFCVAEQHGDVIGLVRECGFSCLVLGLLVVSGLGVLALQPYLVRAACVRGLCSID
jgi:hypothetical protein